MKVTVYAISRNEAKFVDRWVNSMKEADCICVLDTGSDDDTVKLLREHGVKVKQEVISPWRFDVARNLSMEMIPIDTDICVCTDLDEVFSEGWRQKVEEAWMKAPTSPTTATYNYVWSHNEDGTPASSFTYEKIHARGVCHWTHPVHEILEYMVPQIKVAVEDVTLHHYPDPKKSRGQYLNLLKLAVEERPDDDRNMHYYGRELMFHSKWNEAITILKRHLGMKSARWGEERAASMRYIARCYRYLGDYDAAELWYWRSCGEDLNQRESPLELAEMFYERNNYHGMVLACSVCLSRKTRSNTYLTTDRAWGALPWDLYSIGSWYSGKKAEAVEALCNALSFTPTDARLKNNLKLMVDQFN